MYEHCLGLCSALEKPTAFAIYRRLLRPNLSEAFNGLRVSIASGEADVDGGRETGRAIDVEVNC